MPQKGGLAVPDGKQSDPLEIALAGTLAVGSLICIRLQMVTADMREGLTDKDAMAFFMTDEGVVSDSTKAASKLNSASMGLNETEQLVTLFAVSLAAISIALAWRIWRRSRAVAPKPLRLVAQRGKKTAA